MASRQRRRPCPTAFELKPLYFLKKLNELKSEATTNPRQRELESKESLGTGDFEPSTTFCLRSLVRGVASMWGHVQCQCVTAPAPDEHAPVTSTPALPRTAEAARSQPASHPPTAGRRRRRGLVALRLSPSPPPPRTIYLISSHRISYL